MHVLQKVTTIPTNLEEAWSFFSSPQKLKEITPKYLGFDITSNLITEKMYAGMIITYKVKPLLGITMNWMTEITHVKEKQFFVDEQRVGPYKIWHHQHHFKAVDGGVEMTDIINYVLPLGLLGRSLEPFLVKRKLEQIFNYREEKMTELFGSFN